MDNFLPYQELKVASYAGKVAAKIIKEIKRIIKPGITTKDIELFFEKEISKYPEMESAFKGYKGFPASLCVSVNEEVIHGIPSKEKILKEGDLVSVDLGIKYKGLFVDTAFTYLVSKTSSLAKKLVKVCKKALMEGIKKIKVGRKIGDISCAIQRCVEREGFSVIRSFVGHGIGKELHLPPEVPNFGEENTGETLIEGMVLAIEPMIAAGNHCIEFLKDGWTVKTKDNSLTSHFEHTVAVTKKGAWILTQ
ncbi:MAG: type I methionyl aminopeptidase [Candidatus Omnitrophota bacterium]|nr:MAG: type I methionyl aminopeptidase [Candidatus Omnitrophota bacterium]